MIEKYSKIAVMDTSWQPLGNCSANGSPLLSFLWPKRDLHRAIHDAPLPLGGRSHLHIIPWAPYFGHGHGHVWSKYPWYIHDIKPDVWYWYIYIYILMFDVWGLHLIVSPISISAHGPRASGELTTSKSWPWCHWDASALSWPFKKCRFQSMEIHGKHGKRYGKDIIGNTILGISYGIAGRRPNIFRLEDSPRISEANRQNRQNRFDESWSKWKCRYACS